VEKGINIDGEFLSSQRFADDVVVITDEEMMESS